MLAKNQHHRNNPTNSNAAKTSKDETLLSFYSPELLPLLETLIVGCSLSSHKNDDEIVKCSSSAIGLFGSAARYYKEGSSDEERGSDEDETDSSSSDEEGKASKSSKADDGLTVKPSSSVTTGGTGGTLTINPNRQTQVPSILLPLPYSPPTSVSSTTTTTTTTSSPSLSPPRLCLVLPTAILPQFTPTDDNPILTSSLLASQYLNLSRSLQSSERRNITILFLRSGRFAFAVFPPAFGTAAGNNNNAEPLVHQVKTRYTTRKGQGGAQSSNDSAKGKAKSIGSQLRRAGEIGLVQDVRKALLEAKSLISSSQLIFISLPNAMKKNFYSTSAVNIIAKDDPRIRRIPVSVQKPNYEELIRVYQLLVGKGCVVRRGMTVGETGAVEGNRVASDSHQYPSSFPSPSVTNAAPSHSTASSSRSVSTPVARPPTPPPSHPPLTDLHLAAKDGDAERVGTILQNFVAVSNLTEASVNAVNAVAGEKYETPLHSASKGWSTDSASSASSDEAKDWKEQHAQIVILLLRAGADPTLEDSHGRVAYTVSRDGEVRKAFRMYRGEVEGAEEGDGSDNTKQQNWDWSKTFIPAGLDDAMLKEKKEKEREKKRKQKERAKAKKAEEQEVTKVEESIAKEAAAVKAADLQAKRVRAGLETKAAENACDFCNSVAVKRRKDMFFKLDWAYCSTECVKGHQRELSAKAAMARFG
jgi:hypothetical protein